MDNLRKLFRQCTRPAVLVVSALVLSAAAEGQANTPTASRLADLQIGISYSRARPDYTPQIFYGFGGYITYDFTHHYGVEFAVRQTNTTGTNNVYERTYELGGRYVRHYGRFAPFARVNVGRGVFNYPNDVANLAYNIYGIGGGLDVNIIPAINVRADYELQRWPGLPPRGIAPQVATVGIAYHFH